MALSAKKRERILADWKTGEYKMRDLSRKHKVSPDTVSRLCKKIGHDTAHVVEAAAVIQNAQSDKNRTISSTDVQAAIQVAKRRAKRVEMGEAILDVGMQSTLKIAAGVHKDLDRKTMTPREFNIHQKTIKAATETVRIANTDEAPQIIINNSNQQEQTQEQDQEQTTTSVTIEESLVALGLL